MSYSIETVYARSSPHTPIYVIVFEDGVRVTAREVVDGSVKYEMYIDDAPVQGASEKDVTVLDEFTVDNVRQADDGEPVSESRLEYIASRTPPY